MALSVGNKCIVMDQSSRYRNLRGEVVSVDGDDHDVRLYGHSCPSNVRFLTAQLRLDTRDAPLDYTRC